MISIVDYGLGNLGSIANLLKKIGVPSKIVSTAKDILAAEKLILPGVGSFDTGMTNIHQLNLFEALNTKVCDKQTPVLGICLGMQLLGLHSEEGTEKGLGWVPCKIKKFNFEKTNGLKTPHMGWNRISQKQSSPLFDELDEDPRFYFVHSYHAVCADKSHVLATTHYGYDFASIIINRHIVGVQFHPEKSHKFGMKLLKNFVENF